MKDLLKILGLCVVVWAFFATLAVTLSLGADVYIRNGGSGDGSAWNNALGSTPASFTRGNTYWYGDGNYGPPNCNTPASGSTYIYIKKATATSHGTDTGWSASYGDGTAYFTGTWNVSTDYWDISGTARGGNKWGYGFHCQMGSYQHAKIIYIVNGADNLSFKYMELRGMGENTGYGYNQDCFYCVDSADGGSSNVTVAYCWMHYVNRCHVYFNNGQYITFEYNYFSECYNNFAIPHQESFSLNYNKRPAEFYIRYNIFENCKGTGVIVIKNSVQSHFYIYGNLFFRSGDHYTTTNGTVTNTSKDADYVTNIKVYNNTFVDLAGGCTGIMWRDGTNAGNETRNNLFINCSNPSITGATATNNIQWGADPSMFVSYWGDDFRLAYGTSSGTWLSSPYNVDMYGSTRGGDGSWDIGYDEYGGGGPPLTSTTIGSTSSTSAASTSTTAATTSVATTTTTIAETANQITVNVDTVTVSDNFHVTVNPIHDGITVETCYRDTDSGQCVYDDYTTLDYENTINAEDLDHDNGAAASGGWVLYSNGSMYGDVGFTDPSQFYNVTITAKATLAGGVGAHMIFLIDDVEKYSTYVESTDWNTYDFSIDIDDGTHELKITFDNDFYNPPDDRNLYVDTIYMYTAQTVELAAAAGTGNQFDVWTGDAEDNSTNPTDIIVSGSVEATATYKTFTKIAGLAVDSTNGNTVTLSWTENSDADYYTIYYDQDGSAPWAYNTELDVTSSPTSIDVPLLGTWYFQIKAYVDVEGASNAETLYADSSVNTTVYSYVDTTTTSTVAPGTTTTTILDPDTNVGSNVVDHYTGGGTDFTRLRWFSNSEGVSRVNIYGIDGIVWRVAIRPHPYSVPTNDYDAALDRIDGYDILSGSGANLDNETSLVIYPQLPVNNCLTLEVLNAGDTKAGWLYLWWK